MTVIEREVIKEVKKEKSTEELIDEVIEHAAEIIERDGWIKYDLEDCDGRVCVSGAINKSTYEILNFPESSGKSPDISFYKEYGEPEVVKFAELRQNTINKLNCFLWTKEIYAGIVYFNDSLAKDSTDVTRMLREAASSDL